MGFLNSRTVMALLLAQLVGCSSGSNNSDESMNNRYFIDGLNSVNTFALNDTGITLCFFEFGEGVICNLNDFLKQDAMYGRDAAFIAGDLTKTGTGAAGFDFTKLNMAGEPLADQQSDFETTPWRCVRDNHTGLYWEVKTNDGGVQDKGWSYTWYDSNAETNGGAPGVSHGGTCSGIMCDTESYIAAVNQLNLCGFNDWRLPTREEMRSIVDYNLPYLFDPDYFPQAFLDIPPPTNLPIYPYIFWTATTSAEFVDSAWRITSSFIDLNNISDSLYMESVENKSLQLSVRLVRQDISQ